ncbi:MAG: type I methionyl aminopeptidase [Syntrophomonadaceae bacterium]|nr:type I methionyl aminopeptidase [Syntrophomonadaceae bacterium]
MIKFKRADEIARMRRSGQLVARVLEEIRVKAEPGITTGELNAIAEEMTLQAGAVPVFRNYPHPHRGKPFPGAICASVNEEVVHGIPGHRKLQAGDIISIDFGVILNGYAGDAAITIAVGDVAPEVLKLLKVTEEALMKGINAARVGSRIGAVSYAVQQHVESHGFSVVRDYVGHGIGKAMHEDPPVPNYGREGQGPRIKAGMALAIEPMVNLGGFEVYTAADDWTVRTADGKPSAHFEHSIAVRDSGPEILTLL